MTKSHEQSCPICCTAAADPFVRIADVPVQVNVLYATADEARRARRGDLELVACTECGFIWNRAFDPARIDYDAAYDNSLHNSPAFEEYARTLAQRLVERYDLRQKRVVEIGCGQGDFLRLLCEAGGNSGFGYDPSYVGDTSDDRVTILPIEYSERTIEGADPDFVCCRHVLEHLDDPLAFVRSLLASLEAHPHAVVYLEVPNGAYQLEQRVVWDLIYAHYGTYTASSLRNLLERAGFEILDVGTSFGGQYLWAEARRGAVERDTVDGDDAAAVNALAAEFGAAYDDLVKTWKRTSRGYRDSGRRVALWGAGAKGVSLLNALDGDGSVSVVVDLNPRKQGSYVAGEGQPIVGPAELARFGPEVVLLANPIYADEVRSSLAALRLDAELVCV
jgi:SAM-dependent methyltransferase